MIKRFIDMLIIDRYIKHYKYSNQSQLMRKSSLNYFFGPKIYNEISGKYQDAFYYKGRVFDIKTDVLIDYFEFLNNLDCISLTTKKNKWRILVSFLNFTMEYCREYSFIVVIPKKTVEWQKIHKIAESNKDIYATKEEIQQILTYLKDNNYKHYIIFLLLVLTGMRLGELLSITVKDLEIEKRYVKTKGKTGDKVYYFSQEYANVLKVYLKEREKLTEIKTDKLFLNQNLTKYSNRTIQQIITQVCKKCGIEKRITPHTFRRTLNNLREEMECPEEKRCILLNHSVNGVNYNNYVNKDREKFLGYFDQWNPYQDLKL